MLNRTDLFISHSSQDHGIVAGLCEALHSYGISTWFSSGHSRIKAGELWPRHVEDALRAGDQFLLVLSEKALESPHVRDEIQLARKLNKRIFVVSLESQEDTHRLIQQSGFDFLNLVVRHNDQLLKRIDTRDPFDQYARDIATKVKGKSTKRALRTLGVACATACLIIYSGSLMSGLGDGASKFREAVVKMLPTSNKKERVRTAATPPAGPKAAPVAPTLAARTGAAVPPARPAPIQKPFALPRFIKNPEISLRSRLLGTWTAQGPEPVTFNLQYRDGKFEGSAKIGNKCRFLMNSATVEPGYVVLNALPGNESCSIKSLHIGYRTSEKIQIVVEGGELSSQSFYREL